MVFTVDGKQVEWQYDCVTLKIEFDRIDQLPADDRPAALAECFGRYNMPLLTGDVVLRVYSLVKMQFDRLALSIAEQVHSLSEGE